MDLERFSAPSSPARGAISSDGQETGTGQRGEGPVRLWRWTETVEPMPHVGPVVVHDGPFPVAFLQQAQEAQQVPLAWPQVGDDRPGPCLEHLEIAGAAYRRERRGEPGRVGGLAVRQFEQ